MRKYVYLYRPDKTIDAHIKARPVTRRKEVKVILDLKSFINRWERYHITIALRKAGGCKNRAAKMLGLNRTTLLSKIKRLRSLEGSPEERSRVKHFNHPTRGFLCDNPKFFTSNPSKVTCVDCKLEILHEINEA